MLIYGLECFSLWKSDLKSLDFTVTRFLILFRTSNTEIIAECQHYFGFSLPSKLIERKRRTIVNNYNNVLLFQRLVTAMIWQSVLVVVICYLYIYLDFSYILLFVFAATMIMVNKDNQCFDAVDRGGSILWRQWSVLWQSLLKSCWCAFFNNCSYVSRSGELKPLHYCGARMRWHAGDLLPRGPIFKKS